MGEVTRGVVLEVRGEVFELGDIGVSLRHTEREKGQNTSPCEKEGNLSGDKSISLPIMSSSTTN